MKYLLRHCFILLSLTAPVSYAEDIACITYSWKLVGANHEVCVQAFDDPKVDGVSCHISQARTGGIAGSLGVAEDPNQFSLSCSQVGPVSFKEKLPLQETAFAEGTSLLFKETRVTRIYDQKRNTLVYVAVSRKIIDGAPKNSISAVPIMPWQLK